MDNHGLKARAGWKGQGRPGKVQLMASDRIVLAAETLKTAGALLVTGGAGMGVDSGLPDFRGTQGFWRAYGSDFGSDLTL